MKTNKTFDIIFHLPKTRDYTVTFYLQCPHLHLPVLTLSTMLGRASLHLADRGDLIEPHTRTTGISHSCLLLSAPVI